MTSVMRLAFNPPFMASNREFKISQRGRGRERTFQLYCIKGAIK